MGEPGALNEPGMLGRDEPAASQNVGTTAAQVRECIDALAASDDPQAFRELLVLSELVGVALGTSARNLAARGSWSRVAEHAGTTKQAAWSRWH